MFCDSIKEINRLEKEINRLLSKRMSNVYLKVTIEEKTDVLKSSIFLVKKFVMSVLGSSNSQR